MSEDHLSAPLNESEVDSRIRSEHLKKANPNPKASAML